MVDDYIMRITILKGEGHAAPEGSRQKRRRRANRAITRKKNGTPFANDDYFRRTGAGSTARARARARGASSARARAAEGILSVVRNVEQVILRMQNECNAQRNRMVGQPGFCRSSMMPAIDVEIYFFDFRAAGAHAPILCAVRRKKRFDARARA